MDFTWKGANSLVVCTARSDVDKHSQTLHELTTKAVSNCDSPVMRRLVTEFHGIYTKLQKAAADNPSDFLDANELSNYSRLYRSVLRSCCSDLEGRSIDEDGTSLLASLRSAELIWSLADLLFVQSQGGVLACDIRQWATVNYFGGRIDDSVRQILDFCSQGAEGQRAERHEDYWKNVFLLSIFGRLEDARRLLAVHSRHADAVFKSMDELLRKNPFDAVSSSSMGGNSLDYWRQWRAEVEKRLQQKHFLTVPQLEHLAKLLSGDEASVRSLTKKNGGLIGVWYEAIIPLILYRRFDADVHDLASVVATAMSLFSERDEWNWLDEALSELFELSALTALRRMSETAEDWTIPVHLIDLLQKAGLKQLFLDEKPPVSSLNLAAGSVIDLREYLTLEYGSAVMSHQSLWQCGVAYLDSCSVRGADYLTAHLERIPLETERLTLKLLSIAKQRGFTELTENICREMTTKQLKEGNTAAALVWSIRTKDLELTDGVASMALMNSDRTQLRQLCLLDQFTPIMLHSPTLMFLGQYREFELSRGSPQEGTNGRVAAEKVTKLIASRMAPRSLWLTLLLDSVDLMQQEPDNVCFFTKKEIQQLISVVTQIDVESRLFSAGSERFQTSTDSMVDTDDQLAVVRLTLIESLAKTVIFPIETDP